MLSYLNFWGHLLLWGTPIFLLGCAILSDEKGTLSPLVLCVVFDIFFQIFYCVSTENTLLRKAFSLMFIGEWFAIIALVALIMAIGEDNFILVVSFFACFSIGFFINGHAKIEEYKETNVEAFEIVEEITDTPILYFDSDNTSTTFKDFKVIDSGYTNAQRVYFYYVENEEGRYVEEYVPTNLTELSFSLKAYEKPFVRTITEKKVINDDEGDEESSEITGTKYQIFLPENFYLPQIESVY